MGGVFSRSVGFTTVTELLPGLAFHAVTMAAGGALLAKAVSPASAQAEIKPAGM